MTGKTRTDGVASMEESVEINSRQQRKVACKAGKMEDERIKIKKKVADTLFGKCKCYMFY